MNQLIFITGRLVASVTSDEAAHAVRRLFKDEPKYVKIKARDILPYRYAVWCTVGGSEPHANEIVHRRVDEDGKIWFGLDSHNFDGPYDPDDEPTCIISYEGRYGAEFLAKVDADEARDGRSKG